MIADCNPVCITKGGGFCTGPSENDCCPYFNKETELCVKDCAIVHPKFVPDDSFFCGEHAT